MNIIKKCNFCDKQAIVDGKTRMGPWAYMCPDHLQVYGYPASLMNTKLVEAYPSQRSNRSKSLTPCPKCSKIVGWNSHFSCYYCTNCGHMFSGGTTNG